MIKMAWWMRFNQFLTPKRMAYAWITGIVLWVAWIVSILAGGGKMDLAGHVVGTDYVQFYAAGLTVARGDSDKLYDFTYQSQLEREISGPELTGYHAFITPPFLAWLFVPFSLLPYGYSFALWSLLGLLCLLASIALLNRDHLLRYFLLALTWFPVFASISFGQNSLLSLVIMSSVYVLWRKQHRFLAGLTCSLLLYKPQLVLGIALLWLLDVRRDKNGLFGLLTGGGVLAGMCFGLMPEASIAYLAFSKNILPGMIYWAQFPLWHDHTIRSFWLLLIPGQRNIADILTLICSLLALIAFIRFWLQHRREPVLLFASAICFTILITPHAMIYDWVILLIPAVLLWKDKPELQHLWKAVYSIIWVISFISGSLTFAQINTLHFAIQISVPIYVFALFSAYNALQEKSDDQKTALLQV